MIQPTVKEKTEKSFFDKRPILAGTIITIVTIVFVDFLAASFLIKDIDLAVTAIKSRKEHTYYHHALRPNLSTTGIWGKDLYHLETDKFGFKCAKQAEKTEIGKHRLLLIGDSFVEGIGVDYEDSFVGLLDERYPEIKITNAGVVSYSPKLYYLKTKYLLEQKKMQFDELLVFIDVSDIQDELKYESFVPYVKEPGFKDKVVEVTKKYLVRNSFLTNVYYKMKYFVKSEEQLVMDEERGKWPHKEEIFERWGKRGAEMAVNNMDSLLQLCKAHDIKMNLAIHPWPDQVKDRAKNTHAERIFEAFAAKNNINFINFFPEFVNDVEPEIMMGNFIEGDIHWNEVGHIKIARKIIETGMLADSVRNAPPKVLSATSLIKVESPQTEQ